MIACTSSCSITKIKHRKIEEQGISSTPRFRKSTFLNELIKTLLIILIAMRRHRTSVLFLSVLNSHRPATRVHLFSTHDVTRQLFAANAFINLFSKNSLSIFSIIRIITSSVISNLIFATVTRFPTNRST